MLKRIALALVCLSIQLSAIEITGRLPGSQFREDNPPRFGAVMSLVSRVDSVVVLHAVVNKPRLTIADQLKHIAKGFKLPVKALTKLDMVEGTHRWLQYSFRKKNGGGFVYITRVENDFVYLVIFNLSFGALANDLPYIDRYIQQLGLKNEAESLN